MYTGSYETSISGIVSFSGLVLVIAMITLLILPIVMACKFRCNNRDLIIVLNIIFFPFVGPIISFILIAVDQKNRNLYERTGRNNFLPASDLTVTNESNILCEYGETEKNNSLLYIVLYFLSIISLFAPMVEVRDLQNYGIEGITSFNLSFFFSKGANTIGNFVNPSEYQLIMSMLYIMIGAFCLGIILNLIIGDTRKLIGFNTIVQGINASLSCVFAYSCDNGITVPGIAFVFESLITIVFLISLYMTVFNTSYVDDMES